MQADFSYITGKDGFTSVIPNTAQAEAEYNRMFAETGTMRLMPHEFAAFRSAARKAGYSVRVASAPKMNLDDVMAELEAM